MNAINSYVDQKTHQDNSEEMSTIINRLKKFSPTKINSELTETYQANQNDLKRVIQDMEAEREVKF